MHWLRREEQRREEQQNNQDIASGRAAYKNARELTEIQKKVERFEVKESKRFANFVTKALPRECRIVEIFQHIALPNDQLPAIGNPNSITTVTRHDSSTYGGFNGKFWGSYVSFKKHSRRSIFRDYLEHGPLVRVDLGNGSQLDLLQKHYGETDIGDKAMSGNHHEYRMILIYERDNIGPGALMAHAALTSDSLVSGLYDAVQRKNESAYQPTPLPDHPKPEVKASADDADNWLIRGKALRELGQHQEALAVYDERLSLYPNDIVLLRWRGHSLDDLERYEEALESYDKAIALNPDDADLWGYRGDELHNLGRFEESLVSYDKAVTLNPDDADFWFSRGYELYRLERYEESLESYDKGVALEPNDVLLWYFRGDALGKLGKAEEALESYDKAVALDPDDAGVWLERGNTLGKLERFEEALDSYDKAIALDPDEFLHWWKRADTLIELGRYDEASQSYRQSNSIGPR